MKEEEHRREKSSRVACSLSLSLYLFTHTMYDVHTGSTT